MQQIGRTLIILAVVLFVIGLLLVVCGRFSVPFGRMPGDITVQKKNFTVFFPMGSMLIVSIVLSLILNFISRWKR